MPSAVAQRFCPGQATEQSKAPHERADFEPEGSEFEPRNALENNGDFGGGQLSSPREAGREGSEPPRRMASKMGSDYGAHLLYVVQVRQSAGNERSLKPGVTATEARAWRSHHRAPVRPLAPHSGCTRTGATADSLLRERDCTEVAQQRCSAKNQENDNDDCRVGRGGGSASRAAATHYLKWSLFTPKTIKSYAKKQQSMTQTEEKAREPSNKGPRH